MRITVRRTARGTRLLHLALSQPARFFFLLSSVVATARLLFVAAHTRDVGSDRSQRRPFICSAVAVARSSSLLMLWKKESSPELCYYDSIRSPSSGSRVSLEELVRKFDPYRRANAASVVQSGGLLHCRDFLFEYSSSIFRLWQCLAVFVGRK